jgi:hypothetical protein
MKTKWLPSCEFFAIPGRALSAGIRAGRVLVIASGRPKAPASEAMLARDVEILDRVALAQASASIRVDSVLKSMASLSAEAIGVKIAAVRSTHIRGQFDGLS